MSAEFTVASHPQSNKCLGEKRRQFLLYLLLPLWQIIFFAHTGLQIRAGTKEYSLHSVSFQTQANTTAL